MLDIAHSFAELGQRGYVIPRPHPTLITPRVLVMERLEGFPFYEVERMRAAGVDTEAVIRTGMVGFMEGAMIHGIFHGDLHGGNLFVLPDGRVALLDFGITGRMNEQKRLAFLRLLVGGSMNDIRSQLEALCGTRRAPPRHRFRRGHPRSRTRPAASRPHQARRRPDGARAAERREAAAGLRRTHAEGTDVVRQEPGVPRRRDRHAWRRISICSPRSHRSRCTSPTRTASASPPTSASIPRTYQLDMAGVKASFGLDDIDRVA